MSTEMEAGREREWDLSSRKLEDAIALATDAHAYQVYNGFDGRPGEPYILHPLRVMLAVPPEARVVAVLHDVLEDTDESPIDIVDETEWAALLLLTRRKDNETYAAYIDRVRRAEGEAGRLARIVKVADLRENLSHNPPARLCQRYAPALAALASPTEEPNG